MSEVPLGFLINVDFINFKYKDKRQMLNMILFLQKENRIMCFSLKTIDYDIIKAYLVLLGVLEKIFQW